MSPGPQDDRIDDLLVRWEEKREEGQTASAESLCRDCPDLAEELARRIQALIAMDRLVNARTTGCATPRPMARMASHSVTISPGALHRPAVPCGRGPGPGVHGPGR